MSRTLVVVVSAVSRDAWKRVNGARARVLLVGLLLLNDWLLEVIEIVTHLLARLLQRDHFSVLLAVNVFLLNHC